ncbi:MAG: DUF4249 family protein [Candidatus Cryptobacteroides sp.]
MRHLHKILTIVLIALLPVSCEKMITLDGSDEKFIIANGFLNSSDSLHTVSVVKGGFRMSEFETIQSARLQCFVNGEPAGGTDSLVDAASIYYATISKMIFKARFNPGDEVKIEIDADGLHAEIKETVPMPALVTSVDTAVVLRRNTEGNMIRFLQLGVSVSDRLWEDNYYRLMMRLQGRAVVEVLEVPDPDGFPSVGEEIGNQDCSISFDNSEEPVLNKRMDIFGGGENYYDNKYNIFTDALFRNGNCRLSLLVSRYELSVPVRFYSPGQIYMRVSRKIIVSLVSMNRDNYMYLDDLQFEDSSLSDSFLVEEMPYPSNVRGGRGFVGISSRSDFVVNLRDVVTDEAYGLYY